MWPHVGRRDAASSSEPNPEVPQACRIEDAGVISSSEGHDDPSVVEVEALGLGGELSDGLRTAEVVLPHVGEEVSEADTAPVSHPPIRNLVLLEEPDQVGPGHAEHVCSLLGGEFCVHRRNGDGVAVGDVCEQLDHVVERDAGDRDAQVGIVGDQRRRTESFKSVWIILDIDVIS